MHPHHGEPDAERLDDLAQRFAAHAQIYAGRTQENASPLYAHLAAAVAQDRELLLLVAGADRSTQVSHLLFGAVQFLLLGGVEHPLRAFYASCVPTPRPPREAFPLFRAFCRDHAAAISELVTSRRVQTNEVGRCTGLLPAFALAQAWGAGRPLALVEIGASAGLHLLWDRYGYDYSAGGQVGDPTSPVQLACRLLGEEHPPLPARLPAVAWRVGIDRAPISLHDEAATRWLRALVWPEHTDRARLLAAALALARTDPPPLVAGDAAMLLPDLLARVPADATLCVYHSYTLNQCPPATRAAIEAHIADHRRVRDVAEVALEWYGGQSAPHLELITSRTSSTECRLLAHPESHGRALQWLPPSVHEPERYAH